MNSGSLKRRTNVLFESYIRANLLLTSAKCVVHALDISSRCVGEVIGQNAGVYGKIRRQNCYRRFSLLTWGNFASTLEMVTCGAVAQVCENYSQSGKSSHCLKKQKNVPGTCSKSAFLSTRLSISRWLRNRSPERRTIFILLITERSARRDVQVPGNFDDGCTRPCTPVLCRWSRRVDVYRSCRLGP